MEFENTDAIHQCLSKDDRRKRMLKDIPFRHKRISVESRKRCEKATCVDVFGQIEMNDLKDVLVWREPGSLNLTENVLTVDILCLKNCNKVDKNLNLSMHNGI